MAGLQVATGNNIKENKFKERRVHSLLLQFEDQLRKQEDFSPSAPRYESQLQSESDYQPKNEISTKQTKQQQQHQQQPQKQKKQPILMPKYIGTKYAPDKGLINSSTKKSKRLTLLCEKFEQEVHCKKKEERDNKISEALLEHDKAIRLLREQHEQERGDHELALRLAKESNGQIEEFSASPQSTVIKIRELESKLINMGSIIQQLRKDKETSESEIQALRKDLTTAIGRIQADASIKSPQLDVIYTQLMHNTNSQMGSLHKKLENQKNAEEQERVVKMQEEMEMGWKKMRDEEQRKKEEENRIRKAEMEVRRKAEEEERRKQEERDNRISEALLVEHEKEIRLLRERLEQERRDHELALRLVKESNGQIEELSASTRSFSTDLITNRLNQSESVRSQLAAEQNQKYDLSKWKNSELRDTINTSCDIELLEACRIEFHRRLEIYHPWKSENKSMTYENERSPKSIMNAVSGEASARPMRSAINNSQRYFRVPFMRPNRSFNDYENGLVNNNNFESKEGSWYAHFDGQYVAREMELHPDKPAVLRVAGLDDMEMCELSLEETGLTRKIGAEILEHEFDKEWSRHVGKPYVRPSESTKSNIFSQAFDKKTLVGINKWKLIKK